MHGLPSPQAVLDWWHLTAQSRPTHSKRGCLVVFLFIFMSDTKLELELMGLIAHAWLERLAGPHDTKRLLNHFDVVSRANGYMQNRHYYRFDFYCCLPDAGRNMVVKVKEGLWKEFGSWHQHSWVRLWLAPWLKVTTARRDIGRFWVGYRVLQINPTPETKRTK